MNLYCITLEFDSGETNITHLAMNSNKELEEYLKSQQSDFVEAGVEKLHYFHVKETDNGKLIGIK